MYEQQDEIEYKRYPMIPQIEYGMYICGNWYIDNSEYTNDTIQYEYWILSIHKYFPELNKDKFKRFIKYLNDLKTNRHTSCPIFAFRRYRPLNEIFQNKFQEVHNAIIHKDKKWALLNIRSNNHIKYNISKHIITGKYIIL